MCWRTIFRSIRNGKLSSILKVCSTFYWTLTNTLLLVLTFTHWTFSHRNQPIRMSLLACVPLPVKRSIAATYHPFSMATAKFAHWPAPLSEVQVLISRCLSMPVILLPRRCFKRHACAHNAPTLSSLQIWIFSATDALDQTVDRVMLSCRCPLLSARPADG